MEGDTQGVDREATLQEEGHGGLTLAHLRGVDPTPVPDPGLVPRTYQDPIPGLPLGTGPHHSQMMETSRGVGHPLVHHLGDVLSLLWLAMEVLLAPGLLNLCKDLPGRVECSFGSEPVYFALCT